jgi:nucleoside-diphosphate-sugar epimerase
MKVFVVGATGTLGRPTVSRLLVAGHEVTGLARSDESAGRLEREGARAARASLFDLVALRVAVAGHEAVVNLATHIPAGSDAVKPGAWREDDRIRTEGSRTLVDAAIAEGVNRLIQEAVTFVYPERADLWISEKVEPVPNRKSQAATTAAAASAAGFAASGRTGVVLRFGQLYGSDRNSTEVLERARAGKPVVLGRPDGWLSPLHPQDAADAVVAALTIGSGTYNVCENPVLRSHWAAAIGQAAGGGPARFYPALMQRLAGARAEPLTRSLRVSSDKFFALTGWSPSYSSVHGGWSDRPLAQAA